MPPKKPLFTTDEVVPNPIPDETLRRVAPPTPIEQIDLQRGYVPGEAVSGDVREEPVEMVEGAPAPIIPAVIPGGSLSRVIEEWPIHLTSELTLRPGANGAANKQALRGPHCNWVRIDEIKFEVAGLAAGGQQLDLLSAAGSVVRVALALGGRVVTGGFVPVTLFSPSRKQAAENITTGNTGGFDDISEIYFWKLAVPVYVPPGGVLTAVFQHAGVWLFSTRVRISYTGAVLVRAPSQADQGRLPFASAWASPAIALLGGAAGVDTMPETESTEKDLVGPEGADFHVTHMLGRLYVAQQSSVGIGIYDNAAGGGSRWYDVISSAMRLKVDSSWGVPLTTDYVTWWALFDRVNRALLMDHVIPSDGYYVARVRSEYLLLADAVALPMVSLVGWYDSQETCEVKP